MRLRCAAAFTAGESSDEIRNLGIADRAKTTFWLRGLARCRFGRWCLLAGGSWCRFRVRLTLGQGFGLRRGFAGIGALALFQLLRLVFVATIVDHAGLDDAIGLLARRTAYPLLPQGSLTKFRQHLPARNHTAKDGDSAV